MPPKAPALRRAETDRGIFAGMETAFHTRTTGKQLTYRIEYDAAGYKIFYKERFLKMGTLERDPKLPKWAAGGGQEALKKAVADIEQLDGMPEL